LLLLCSCSFFATEGPRPPPGPTACNLHSAPIFVDAAVVVGAAFATAMSSAEGGRGVDVIAPAATSGLFAISTAYGWFQVHSCRAAHELRPQPSLADMPAVM
jgi:hypothetical protein